jgi:hypothetical protein
MHGETVKFALWYFIYLNEVLKLLSVHVKGEIASDSEMKKKTDTNMLSYISELWRIG